MDKSYRHLISKICVGLLICVLVASNAVTLRLYLQTFETDEMALIDKTGDEITRVKYFISDWYDELNAKHGQLTVFHNELQLKVNDKNYTLTIASDRIRAVFPRGTRFFKLEYVSYIEFFQDDGHLKCKLQFNGTGEFVFNIH